LRTKAQRINTADWIIAAICIPVGSAAELDGVGIDEPQEPWVIEPCAHAVEAVGVGHDARLPGIEEGRVGAARGGPF